MKKLYPALLLAASILASLGGIAVFIVLFIPDFNMYWLILAPVILAIYQIPAFVLFRLYKKAKKSPESEKG